MLVKNQFIRILIKRGRGVPALQPGCCLYHQPPHPLPPLSSIWDGCFVDVVRILSVAVLLVHRVENTMVAFSDES